MIAQEKIDSRTEQSPSTKSSNKVSASELFDSGDRRTHKIGRVIGMSALLAAWFALIAYSWSQAAQAAEGEDGPGNGVSQFQWLDPDKKIYVLQNRKFTKAFRPELSVLLGTGFSNPYRQTLQLEPRLAFYFHEDFGVEGFYSLGFNFTNNAYAALLGTNSAVNPVIREITYETGGLLKWSPWYAKINVFNFILYFDWYLTGGAGLLHAERDARTNLTDAANYVGENYFAGFFGTGHQYHLSRHFLIRMDFTAALYSARVLPNSVTRTENALFTNFKFVVGAGFRL